MKLLELFALLTALTWSWNPVADADGYRIYWTVSPVTALDWPACQMIETIHPDTDVTDVEFILPDPLPGEVVFITVTAFNVNGESSTGWAEGETHGPIIPCP